MIATLTYVWHDCFVLETPSATFVFDYWKDPTAADERQPRLLEMIDPSRPVYVLVSHFHKDHFNRCIFEWGKLIADIRFILSKDVERHIRYMLREGSTYEGYKPERERVITLRPGEEYNCGNVKISAFSSTDTGNSYLIETDGLKAFHAGDLNAWIWKDESTAAEVAAAIRDYAAILAKIAEKSNREIDIAMFPVDSRIGRDYFTGARMFVSEIRTRQFVAMHYGLGTTPEEQARYERDASDFSAYANPTYGCYAALRQPYETLAVAF